MGMPIRFHIMKPLAFMLTLLIVMQPVSGVAQPTESDKAVLQLRWDHQFQFAGYYAAQWLGYYKAEGLDVEIRSAFSEGRILDATAEVVEERADFGVGAANLLIAQDSGKKLSLVASIFQRSAVEYCTLAKTPGHSIYNLSRLHIARRPNDLLDLELQALFLSEGIPPQAKQFTDISRDFTLEDLESGAFEVVPEYLGQISYTASRKGTPLKIIRPAEYGVDFYGDTLFTSSALASSDPDLVERFRRASLKGWTYALEHPEEIADRIADMVTEQRPEASSLEELKAFNRFQAEKVQELTHYPIVEIGNINPMRWGKMAKTMNALGIISKVPDLDTMIFDYDKVSLRRFQETERFVKVMLVTLLAGLTLSFLIYLKWRNTLLHHEIDVRQAVQRQLTLSNSRYETIFRSSVLGITITDYDGRIHHVNDAWCRMTGLNSEELCAMNINDLIAPESSGMDSDQLKALRDGQITSYAMEKKYRRRPNGPEDRDFFYGKMVLTQIWDLSTETTLTMSMVTDITRDVLAAEAANRSEERFRLIIGQVAREIGSTGEDDGTEALRPANLEAINLELERLFTRELEENRRKDALIRYQARMAAMGEMIGNIAHQWRQPLNTLKFVLLNLKDSAGDSAPVETACVKANSLIKRMSDTIDDFRNFSKPLSEPSYFLIDDALKVVMSLMEEHMRMAGISVRTECSAIPPLFGWENQFSHVLFNLFSNAVDALKTNGPRVPRVITVLGQSDDEYVAIRIQDTGPGIPKALSEQVFDMYFSTKGSEGGTGLGLYMARDIIESSFHGLIRIIDTPVGCTFEIRIPNHERTVPDYEKCTGI